MKTIQKILLALCALILGASCTVPVPGGQLAFGPRQQGYGGGYNGGGYNPHQQPWGEKIVTKQKYFTEEIRGVGMEIQGTPPTNICVQTKEAVGQWCRQMHTTHGTWPTHAEATVQAQKEFARLGYNVTPAESPRPNSFKIVRYDLHEPKIGQPVATGEPVVTKTEIGEQEVPTSILARSRAGESGILYEQ